MVVSKNARPVIILNAITGQEGGWVEFIQGYADAIVNNKNKFFYILIINKYLEQKLTITSNDNIKIVIMNKPKSIKNWLITDYRIARMCRQFSATLYNLGNMPNIFHSKNQYTRISNSIYLDPCIENSLGKFMPRSYKRKKYLFWLQCLFATKLSKKSIVPSNFMKELLMINFKNVQDKVAVVNPGIKSFEDFWLNRKSVKPSSSQSGEFIIFDTATYGETKNYSLLYDLMVSLRKDHNIPVKLWSYANPYDCPRENKIVDLDKMAFRRAQKADCIEVLPQYSHKQTLFEELIKADMWISFSQTEALSYTTLDINQLSIPKLVVDNQINREFADKFTNFLDPDNFSEATQIIISMLDQSKKGQVEFIHPRKLWHDYLVDIEHLFEQNFD